MFIGGGVIQKGNTILYSNNVEIIDLDDAAECIPSHLEIPIGMCFNPFDIHWFNTYDVHSISSQIFFLIKATFLN